MITMTPVLARGLTDRDHELFPQDEFEERTRLLQAELRDLGVSGLIVCAPAWQPNGEVGFLSGWPMSGIIFLPTSGEPMLLTYGSGRELYFQRQLTWLAHMRSGGEQMPTRLVEELDKLSDGCARLATVGLGGLAAPALRQMRDALGSRELVDFDARFAAFRARKRPREILAVRRALGIARGAVAAGRATFAKGASNTEALVEAEQVARRDGARDWRGLANLAGSSLAPFERPAAGRHAPLLLWAGVDYHGYWAEAASGDTDIEGPATAAVAAMVAAARAGARAGDLAEAALANCRPPQEPPRSLTGWVVAAACCARKRRGSNPAATKPCPKARS